MNKMHSLAVCALMAPAITLSAGSAFAVEPSATPDRAQEQSQPRMPGQAQHETEMGMDPQRSQMSRNVQGSYLSIEPYNSFRAGELIGTDLVSRPDGETIGGISDLLVDDNGQIMAVIVEVGGFLGLGEKEVAISWDAVEHGMNAKGDEHQFSVSVTRDALTKAPEFKSKASK